ncbi:hypothetical protein YC2023_100353 [Brassica napus]
MQRIFYRGTLRKVLRSSQFKNTWLPQHTKVAKQPATLNIQVKVKGNNMVMVYEIYTFAPFGDYNASATNA